MMKKRTWNIKKPPKKPAIQVRVRRKKKCSVKNVPKGDVELLSLDVNDIPEVGVMEFREAIPPKMRDEIDKINAQKNRIKQLSKERKIILATTYSKCSDCVHSCSMWIGIQPVDANHPCDNCHHPFKNHSVEILNMTDSALNRFLNIAADIENLQSALHAEIDPNLKTVYYYLINILLKARDDLKRPDMRSDSLFNPLPFECPNVNQIMNNFIHHFYGKYSPKVWKNVRKLASFALRYMKYNCMDVPSSLIQRSTSPPEDEYKECYFRWIVLSRLPLYCNSLSYYDPLAIFGRQFLSFLFPTLTERMIMKINERKSDLPDEMRLLLQRGMLPFLEAFWIALVDDSCPIWSPDYKCEPEVGPHEIKVFLENSRPAEMKECVGIFANVNGTRLFMTLLKKSVFVPRVAHTFLAVAIDKSSLLKKENILLVDTYAPQTVYNILKIISSGKNKKQANCDETGAESSRRDNKDHFATQEKSGGLSEVFIVGKCRGIVNRKAFFLMISLLEIFSRQLPRMPKKYISRLIFDTEHKTLTLVKDNIPVGGICFRVFEDWGFAEVVFCAVTASEQVKGYGTYLMNNLKDYLISNGIKDILTYADSTAIGYFEKQGYSKSIIMPEATYEDALKCYDDATLMHCRLHQRITYSLFATMVAHTLDIVHHVLKYRDKALEYTAGSSDTLDFLGAVYPGPRCFSIKALLPLNSIPEFQSCLLPSENVAGGNFYSLNQSFKSVYKSLESNKYSAPFLIAAQNERDDAKDAKNSYIDLMMIEERLKNNYYVDLSLFKGDVMRMIQNAYRFNTPDSEIYKCAVEVESVFYASLKKTKLISRKQ